MFLCFSLSPLFPLLLFSVSLLLPFFHSPLYLSYFSLFLCFSLSLCLPFSLYLILSFHIFLFLQNFFISLFLFLHFLCFSLSLCTIFPCSPSPFLTFSLMPHAHRHLRYIDRLMALTTCLACIVSTVSDRSKKS